MKPDEWLYSSYPAILSSQQTLVNRNEILNWFGGQKVAPHKIKIEFESV